MIFYIKSFVIGYFSFLSLGLIFYFIVSHNKLYISSILCANKYEFVDFNPSGVAILTVNPKLHDTYLKNS
jgi:hypothetical protein